jgi:hypothetical protein
MRTEIKDLLIYLGFITTDDLGYTITIENLIIAVYLHKDNIDYILYDDDNIRKSITETATDKDFLKFIYDKFSVSLRKLKIEKLYV